MNWWLIAAIVIIFVVPPAILAFSLAKAAARADRCCEEHAMLERLWRTEGDG